MSNIVEAILCVPVLLLWFGPGLVVAAPALWIGLRREPGPPRPEQRPVAPRAFGVARLRRA